MSTPMVKVRLASGEVVRARILEENGGLVSVAIQGMFVRVKQSQIVSRA